MYEIKTEGVYEGFSKDKNMFNFSNYSTKSNFYNDWDKLVVDKMKDETAGVAMKELFGLKTKKYFFWYMIVISIKK